MLAREGMRLKPHDAQSPNHKLRLVDRITRRTDTPDAVERRSVLLEGSTLVVVADGSIARFLLRQRSDAYLAETTENRMTAPPPRPERDRAPRVQDSFGGARHAIERRMTAHEIGEAKFVSDVAGRTIALIREHHPACVALCAPPRALGQLRKLLAHPLSGLSVVSIDKDITKESVSVIDARVRELHA